MPLPRFLADLLPFKPAYRAPSGHRKTQEPMKRSPACETPSLQGQCAALLHGSLGLLSGPGGGKLHGNISSQGLQGCAALIPTFVFDLTAS
jgi:hypothetical protein